MSDGPGGGREHEDSGEDRADTRRGADRECAPEQHARASAPRPFEQARADEPLGPRQETHEGKAEDDEDEARDLLEQELIREEPPPDERSPDSEQDEDGRESEDERNARDDDATARSRPAELVGVDSRYGGQVPGNERENARGEERHETGEKGDRQRPEIHVRRRTVRAPRRGDARGRGRRGAPREASPRDGELQPRMRIASATPAPMIATSGTSHASSPNPPLRGVARTPGPNCATSAPLISGSVSPAAIRSRMNAFMRSATGAFDWSRVVLQTGQTNSASRSAAFGGSAPAATGRPSSRNASTAATPTARRRFTTRARSRSQLAGARDPRRSSRLRRTPRRRAPGDR